MSVGRRPVRYPCVSATGPAARPVAQATETGDYGDEDEVDRARRGAAPCCARFVAAAPLQQPAHGPGRLLQDAKGPQCSLDQAPGPDPRRLPGAECPERQGRPLRTVGLGVVGPGLPLGVRGANRLCLDGELVETLQLSRWRAGEETAPLAKIVGDVVLLQLSLGVTLQEVTQLDEHVLTGPVDVRPRDRFLVRRDSVREE